MFPGMVVGIAFLGINITVVILECDEIPNEKYQRWSILIEIRTSLMLKGVFRLI